MQRKLVLAPEYGGDGGKTAGPVRDQDRADRRVSRALGAQRDGAVRQAAVPRRTIATACSSPFTDRGIERLTPRAATTWCSKPWRAITLRASARYLPTVLPEHVEAPGQAAHRPSGVAVGPDGSLFVSDDVRGRIYRIVYRGRPGASAGAATVAPCPGASAPAGAIRANDARPPEGTHPDAGHADATARLPVPAGATKEMVALGDRIFHGQVGGATCTGCHGGDAKGTPLGPDLTDTQWLWGDGSYAAITKIINSGVPQPKQYRSPMPPMGGTQLTSEQVSALAAYIWAVSHR